MQRRPPPALVTVSRRTRTDDRYRQLFEQNTAVQLVVDPADARIVDANGAAAAFYGIARESLVQSPVTVLAALPDDDTLQMLEVAAELGTHSYALPHQHASGDVRLVEIHAGPLHVDDRTLVHMIVHDVTERVRAEETARTLFAERAVHQQTLALHEQLRRRETMSRMGELVAAVAHEVRNPLFAISSTLDAMRDRVGDTPDFQRYYPVLAGQVDRLSTLMRDLLEYGKPVTLTLAPHDPEALVRLAVAWSDSLARERDVRITLRPSPLPATPPVLGDRQRLLQVLQNLIANAVQHSPDDGEVEIEVAPAPAPTTAAAPAPREVVFTVHDRGPGFPDDTLARIFEPFFSRRPGGTGLGLALAHRLVHDHGGHIEARNREGGGATLVVRIPAVPDAS